MLPRMHFCFCSFLYKIHNSIVILKIFFSITIFSSSSFSKFQNSISAPFFQNVAFSRFCRFQRVTMIASASIMHQYAKLTHKVGMTILNLKVKDFNKFIEFKQVDAIDSCCDNLPFSSLACNMVNAGNNIADLSDINCLNCTTKAIICQ